MEINKLNTHKGVAGLEILVSLIATLFVVGVLVMAFTIAGSKMADSISTDTTGTIYNETLTTVGDAGDYLTLYSTYGSSCSVVRATNSTDGYPIASGNFSQTGTGNCLITFTSTVAGDQVVNGTNWNITYTYSYPSDQDAVVVINDTKLAIAGVTDWFDTFIVIGAVVVLVLLIVLVILAIRRAGLMGGGDNA